MIFSTQLRLGAELEWFGILIFIFLSSLSLSSYLPYPYLLIFLIFIVLSSLSTSSYLPYPYLYLLIFPILIFIFVSSLSLYSYLPYFPYLYLPYPYLYLLIFLILNNPLAILTCSIQLRLGAELHRFGAP